ncbi:MAG: hypothetical protein ACPGR7_08225 [Flavobacteriaceae bacterium]
MKKILLVLSLSLILLSCEQNKKQPSGLWLVTEVSVGDQKMTPQGRWLKLNVDGSQESGNGWLKHSEGSFDFDEQKNSLSINNSNGINDMFPAFNVSFEADKMIWNRDEEGEQVQVTLEPISKLPKTPANTLLGLWKLKRVSFDGQNITSMNNPSGNRYLNVRWDGVFVDQNGPEGRLRGPYRIHGHNPEIEFIYYGDCAVIDRYEYEVSEDQLKLINSEEGSLIMEYERIHEFPNE